MFFCGLGRFFGGKRGLQFAPWPSSFDLPVFSVQFQPGAWLGFFFFGFLQEVDQGGRGSFMEILS